MPFFRMIVGLIEVLWHEVLKSAMCSLILWMAAPLSPNGVTSKTGSVTKSLQALTVIDCVDNNNNATGMYILNPMFKSNQCYYIIPPINYSIMLNDIHSVT
eukprot:m.36969 g.36969  ORF g.36969 m.36969 type:complete len:101 (+) comp9216_c0_seq2:1331-1633(+)